MDLVWEFNSKRPAGCYHKTLKRIVLLLFKAELKCLVILLKNQFLSYFIKVLVSNLEFFQFQILSKEILYEKIKPGYSSSSSYQELHTEKNFSRVSAYRFCFFSINHCQLTIVGSIS